MPVVKINWTEKIEHESLDWNCPGVLYMYATDTEPIYVGIAGGCNPKQRRKKHENKVLKWIRNSKNVDEPVWVKIGRPELDGRSLTWEMLYDLETIIIYTEASRYGRCRANIAKTKSYSKWRHKLSIVNTGFYEPLAHEYAPLEAP